MGLFVKLTKKNSRDNTEEVLINSGWIVLVESKKDKKHGATFAQVETMLKKAGEA